jgi:Tfp pilus assembly protein PilX
MQTRGAHRRHRERGIALILTLLVLLILYAVVSQLMLSARLDYQIAKTQASLARIDAAIESAFADAETMLQDDLLGGAGGGGALGEALGGASGSAGGGDLGSLLGGAA